MNYIILSPDIWQGERNPAVIEDYLYTNWETIEKARFGGHTLGVKFARFDFIFREVFVQRNMVDMRKFVEDNKKIGFEVIQHPNGQIIRKNIETGKEIYL